MISSLKRINELAAKARNEGLTIEETKERAHLRQEYLREIRGQLLTTMTSLTLVNESGEDITPTKLIVEKTKKYRSTFPF
ncbi:DUF896 domain-containing protein [Paenibacillus sp. GCM10012306]|uniref:DUF896 domain-containing protein n=1 Tax=Paenibacillus sp. GCM10012306 TaxID=3317342 RepID=UPI00360FCDCF